MNVTFNLLVIGHCMMQLYCILYDVCIEKNRQADSLSAPILTPTAVVTQQQANLSSSATYVVALCFSFSCATATLCSGVSAAHLSCCLSLICCSLSTLHCGVSAARHSCCLSLICCSLSTHCSGVAVDPGCLYYNWMLH